MNLGRFKDLMDAHLDKQFDLQQINGDTYQSAAPFPHCVMETILPPNIMEQILKEFPPMNSDTWTSLHVNVNENKRASDKFFKWGPCTQLLFIYLNSKPFLKRLEKLTGVPKLIPDPYFLGGGLHCLPQNGKLNMHIDFNEHRSMNLDRRLNLLIYLNKNWKEEYGGNLILEIGDQTRKVVPECNRSVLFSTTSKSFHGNPEPVRAPNGRTRNSLALYYYTSSRPEEEQVTHTTIFRLQEDQMVKSVKTLRNYEKCLEMIRQVSHGNDADNVKIAKIKQIFK